MPHRGMPDDLYEIAKLYRDADLYTGSSELRQRLDAEWVLTGLPKSIRFSRCLDLGCGDGQFLAALIRDRMVTKSVVGIDQSTEMLAAARKRLNASECSHAVTLCHADLRKKPHVEGCFDLVSMLAVLHWLHPNEIDVIRWAAQMLGPNGLFCLTTYHSELGGGTDDIVLEAMQRIGVETGFPIGFLSMQARTISSVETEASLRAASLEIQSTATRLAATRVTGRDQYIDYHLATFGHYYLRLLPETKHGQFLIRLGDIAMERMKEIGSVTQVNVRLWICTTS